LDVPIASSSLLPHEGTWKAGGALKPEFNSLRVPAGSTADQYL
jgi:hypothetical protein